MRTLSDMSAPNHIGKHGGTPAFFLKTVYAGFRKDPSERGTAKIELDIHILDLLAWPGEMLFQITGLYEDITVHQATGNPPQVGDVVRLVDREKSHIFAISNTDSYTAFFDRKQLHPL